MYKHKNTFVCFLSALAVTIGAINANAAEGQRAETQTTSRLKVCSDPGNMPFSSEKEKGFENEIIELVAENLGLRVDYTWFPQTIGFVRTTLRARRCDLISGISTSSELVQNTNPYYRSTYSLIYRNDAGLTAKTIDDPQLRGLRFGVVAGTPPAAILTELGEMANTKPYNLMVDTRLFSPVNDAIKDVANEQIDVAILWGPAAGYFVAQHKNLILVPITSNGNMEASPYSKLDYRVSMAVRYGETKWKRRINTALKELQPEIQQILLSYQVPLLDDLGNVIEP